MKTKRDLVNSWIDKAEKDLRSAAHELSFADVVTETVCFHKDNLPLRDEERKKA
ncbi:hypothetical protein LR007_02625 [candidate division NPL-UPA2 bacterium]|nr:hypothetical protein [candidate division NPL-UPA2 bacterium]